MTAKDELLQKARGWTERQAEVALKAVDREHHAAEDVAEEWGDLSALKAAARADEQAEDDED